MSNYDVVIGLEVHAQLSTQTKMFCSCPVSFGEEPNRNVCPVCLGMPGVLPVPNEKAVAYAVKLGLATNCEINHQAMWTRKNYFYPDLPKGYQITQQGGSPVYDQPICKNGYLEIQSPERGPVKIGLTRIHMEEDAGKLIHDLSPDESLFDANRCGTPLCEIVSEPDLKSPKEASLFLEKVRQILQYLGISDADMEKGNLRCDVNVSLRKSPDAPFGQKVEMKNMNSFNNIEKALEAEISLQTIQLDRGETVAQVTKRFDPNTGKTVVMRSKEEAEDYRYFPEPDLIRLSSVDDVFIEIQRKTLPELPDARTQRYRENLGLSEYDSDVLTKEKNVSDYFEEVCKKGANAKSAANWVMGEVMRVLNEGGVSIQDIKVSPDYLAELLLCIEKGEISGRIAKQVFQDVLDSGDSPLDIIEKKGLKVVSDSGALEKMVVDVIDKNPKQVEEYRAGKEKVLGFFVGQIMKATQGKADPAALNKILKEKLTA